MLRESQEASRGMLCRFRGPSLALVGSRMHACPSVGRVDLQNDAFRTNQDASLFLIRTSGTFADPRLGCESYEKRSLLGPQVSIQHVDAYLVIFAALPTTHAGAISVRETTLADNIIAI